MTITFHHTPTPARSAHFANTLLDETWTRPALAASQNLTGSTYVWYAPRGLEASLLDALKRRLREHSKNTARDETIGLRKTTSGVFAFFYNTPDKYFNNVQLKSLPHLRMPSQEANHRFYTTLYQGFETQFRDIDQRKLLRQLYREGVVDDDCVFWDENIVLMDKKDYALPYFEAMFP